MLSVGVRTRRRRDAEKCGLGGCSVERRSLEQGYHAEALWRGEMQAEWVARGGALDWGKGLTRRR